MYDRTPTSTVLARSRLQGRPRVGSIFVDGIRLLASVVHRLLNQRNHSQLLESNTASIIMGDYGKVPVVPLAQFGNVDR